MLLEQFLFLYEKIVTDQIDQIDFTKFDASQFLLSQNQRDDKNLLEKLRIYEPNFSSKNEQFHSSIEKANWLNLELVKIYKKYSEPYKLSYHSVNVPSIDLEKVYKIRSYAISLNSNFIESRPISIDSILKLKGGSSEMPDEKMEKLAKSLVT